MAVPHRNDVAARAALSPYDHNHSAVEETGADPANLAVVKPVVDHRHRVAGKHLLGVNREIETPMCKGPVALGRIEGCLHGYSCNGMLVRHQGLCNYIIDYLPAGLPPVD
jgi:hypothetical protein